MQNLKTWEITKNFFPPFSPQKCTHFHPTLQRCLKPVDARLCLTQNWVLNTQHIFYMGIEFDMCCICDVNRSSGGMIGRFSQEMLKAQMVSHDQTSIDFVAYMTNDHFHV